MKKLTVVILATVLAANLAMAQEDGAASAKDDFKRHAIGTSLFMTYNFFPDAADYYMLSYGYHFSERDVLIVEAWTWKYDEPIGTYGDSEESYPGKVRAYGIGAGYQRFHWKKLYTTIEATPLVQQFYDEDNNKIQKGFQLYCQLILGYRFELFNRSMYIEPAWALKYWPVNTNFPDDFAAIEKGQPNHIFEPSLNIGFRF